MGLERDVEKFTMKLLTTGWFASCHDSFTFSVLKFFSIS